MTKRLREHASTTRPIARSVGITVLLLVTLLGALLRLYHLGDQPLWYDEAVSYTRALLPLQDLISTTIATDAHPPFYYILLHLFLSPGESEYIIRLPSVIFGILTLMLTFGIARTIGDTRLALISTGLVALSPLQIIYSQEARLYSLYCFSAALALWGLAVAVKAHRTPDKTAAGAGRFSAFGFGAYIIGTTLTLHASNTGIFFLVCANTFGIYWLWLERSDFKPLFWRWFVSNLIIVALWSPWIPSLVRQSRAVSSGANWFGSDFSSFLDLINDLWITNVWAFRPVFALILSAILVLGWRALRREPIWIAFLFIFFLLPPVAAYLVSQWTPILVTRSLLWAAIPLAIIISAAVCSLPNRWLISGAIGFLLLLNLKGAIAYYREYQKERWDQVAEYIGDNHQSHDGILVNPGYLAKALDYYQKRKNLPIPVDPFPLDHGQVLAEDIGDLRAYLASHKRIWVVRARENSGDPNNLLFSTVAQQKKQTSMHTFRRTGFESDCKKGKCIELYLFEPK